MVSFGQSSQLDVATSENDLQGVEALTLVRGNHQVGIGVNGQYIAFNNDLPNRFAGVYIFPTVADLAQETPMSFCNASATRTPRTRRCRSVFGCRINGSPGMGSLSWEAFATTRRSFRNRFPVPRTTGLRV